MALVSVIIPAYNAQETLRETVLSALAQTHKDLEVIIVNDGSSDNTLAIAQDLAARYPNVQAITQKNAGVAVARNTAIAASKGDYIAPLDADDLWHPLRIELQLKAIKARGGKTALAYSPFYNTRRDGMITGASDVFDVNGEAFKIQIRRNLVGNGSGFLATRAAVLDVGGYSPELQKYQAQGCEDLMIQMEIARKYEYVSVPYYLILYRLYDGNMSSNNARMLRSRILMLSHFEKTCPEHRKALHLFRMELMARLAFHLLNRRKFKEFDAVFVSQISNIKDILYFCCLFCWVTVENISKKIWKYSKLLVGQKYPPKKNVYLHDIASLPPATNENVRSYFEKLRVEQ